MRIYKLSNRETLNEWIFKDTLRNALKRIKSDPEYKGRVDAVKNLMNKKGYNVNYPDNYNVRFGKTSGGDESSESMAHLMVNKSSGLIRPQGQSIRDYNRAKGTNYTWDDVRNDPKVKGEFDSYRDENIKAKKFNIDVMDRLRTQKYSKKGPLSSVSNLMKLNKGLKRNTETLGHELTHLNQHMERPEMLKNYVSHEDDKKAYAKHPSEVEARKVGKEVRKGISGWIDPVIKDSFKDAVKSRYPKIYGAFTGNKPADAKSNNNNNNNDNKDTGNNNNDDKKEKTVNEAISFFITRQ